MLYVPNVKARPPQRTPWIASLLLFDDWQVAKLLKAKQQYKELTGNDYAPPPPEKKAKPTPKPQVGVVNHGHTYHTSQPLLPCSVHGAGGSARVVRVVCI